MTLSRRTWKAGDWVTRKDLDADLDAVIRESDDADARAAATVRGTVEQVRERLRSETAGG